MTRRFRVCAYPLALTAAGDHGPVPLSLSNELPGAETGSRVNVAANSVDTNVRISATTLKQVSALSPPFDVTPPAIQFPGVAAVDVACDPVSHRLYAVVPTNAASHAGRLVRVAPGTGAVEASIPIGFNPVRVAVDDLGRYAYVAGTNGLIRRFRLDTQLADLEWPLGAGLIVEDLAVMPGHPEVLAVSQRNTCCDPHHAGVVLFDNGVARPGSPMDLFGPNRIEFGATSNRLYGINTETNSFTFFRMNATSGGLIIESTTNGFGGFGADFRFGGGRVYSTLGQIADAETGTSAGTVPWAGPVAVESSAGRVFSLQPRQRDKHGGSKCWPKQTSRTWASSAFPA
jgi:DNA-binding beta-propeller fold protein YncE